MARQSTLSLSLAVMIAAFPAGSYDVARTFVTEFPAVRGLFSRAAQLKNAREQQVENFERLYSEAQRVVALVDAGRSPVERESLIKLLLGTAAQESRGLHRRQNIRKTVTGPDGKKSKVVVPEGVARGLYQMEPWIAVSVLEYLHDRPEGRDWVLGVFGPEVGADVWLRLQSLDAASRVHNRVIERAIAQLPPPRRVSAMLSMRRAWLSERASSFTLRLGSSGAPLSVAEQLEQNDAFATLLARVYYHRLLKSTPLTTAAAAKAWKRYWNTPAGKGTEAGFRRRFRTLPARLGAPVVGEVWSVRSGQWASLRS